MFQVAGEVGVLPQDLEERLTEVDLLEWAAFFRLRNEAEREAVEEARNGR